MIKKQFKCSIEYTIDVMGAKWKPMILWYLGSAGVHRYGELQKKLSKITHKILAQKLKELETDELIIRKSYNQIPPRVEYWLSPKGEEIYLILDQMCQWGEKYGSGYLLKQKTI